MKNLFLLRHAKSSWKDPSLDDHDRPLNKRGKRDAPRMGQIMIQNELRPELILCSSSKRTRQTLKRIRKVIGERSLVRLEASLYHAEPNEIFQLVQHQTDQLSSILLIGHNPGLEIFLAQISNEREVMPTACLVHLEVMVHSWCEVGRGSANLMGIWCPKELVGI